MKVGTWLATALIGLGISSFAMAQSPTGNLKSDKAELTKVDQAIKQDRATGNKTQLKKDRKSRREVKARLQKDRAESKVHSK